MYLKMQEIRWENQIKKTTNQKKPQHPNKKKKKYQNKKPQNQNK